MKYLINLFSRIKSFVSKGHIDNIYNCALENNLLQNNMINYKKTEHFFSKQMGSIFTGVENLKIHEKYLLAIFSAIICYDYKGAFIGIKDIRENALNMNDLYLPSIEKLIKYIDNAKVQKIINKHRYVYGILLEMLKLSRERKIINILDFVFLKREDKVLYSILYYSNDRFKPLHVAGVFAHLKAENLVGEKIKKPTVDLAVKHLALTLEVEYGIKNIKNIKNLTNF